MSSKRIRAHPFVRELAAGVEPMLMSAVSYVTMLLPCYAVLSATAASWGEFCTIPFDTAKVDCSAELRDQKQPRYCEWKELNAHPCANMHFFLPFLLSGASADAGQSQSHLPRSVSHTPIDVHAGGHPSTVEGSNSWNSETVRFRTDPNWTLRACPKLLCRKG
jgi:hypothetical protein